MTCSNTSLICSKLILKIEEQYKWSQENAFIFKAERIQQITLKSLFSFEYDSAFSDLDAAHYKETLKLNEDNIMSFPHGFA